MDIKTLCLGGLILGEASGYDLKKRFEDGPFAHFHHASFGSIYPALASLLKDGLVTCREEAQGGRPGKKTYAITEAGRAHFRHDLAKVPLADRVRSESLFMLFFSNFLDEAHLHQVFEGYLDGFREKVRYLDELDDGDISDGRRFVRGLGRALYETAAIYMDEHRHLVLGAGNAPGAAEQLPPQKARA